MFTDLINETMNPKSLLRAKCDNCSTNSDVNIRENSVLLRAPAILTIQLLRFEFVSPTICQKNLCPMLCHSQISLPTGDGKSSTYQHRSTVSHVGRNSTSGHYVAYKKFQGRFFRLSDDKCTEMNEADFSSAALNNGPNNETPYILIYDRIA
jgi:hypothetical protein